MKKLLLIFLFVSGLFFGQNIELLRKINNSDSLFTRELSEKIFDGFTILPEREQDKNTITQFETLVLMPKNRSEKDVSDYMNGYGCKKCVYVRFERRVRNSNPDLKIPGDVYYVFKEAQGEFLDMFAFWKKEVQPEATTDKTYESRPVYTYKNTDKMIWLNFWRVNNGWMLRNESFRSLPW